MNFHAFAGDKRELQWNWKDLESLRQVVKIVPEKRVVIQAGGCLGVFAKYLAEHFETVYTFEPNPEAFVLMTRNAPEKNIVRFQAALGSERAMVNPVCALRDNDGKAELHIGMTRVENEIGIIPTMKIDDLALPHCDLIYLDVEGWELYALRGARETILKHKPVIACEINRGIEYFGIKGDDLRTHIRLLGYKPAMKIRSDEVFVPNA